MRPGFPTFTSGRVYCADPVVLRLGAAGLGVRTPDAVPVVVDVVAAGRSIEATCELLPVADQTMMPRMMIAASPAIHAHAEVPFLAYSPLSVSGLAR